ncbi:molybdate ABC transporter substrate-binding protein [uncultured Roseobacter sp.]|uniref:molybdate ABC transporter substrate-binding protein n=1 Tax=uncultured Roseobacter sp. TaxID=114847 RepID=UPI0026197BBD|nr:molybdate ABC transporter substrate-binding protein [uncultured Roseobacter sp.]
MIPRILSALILLCSCLTLTVTTVRAEQITVFAAASLKNALEEIAAAYESQSGHSVLFSFAGSSVLARQIGLGAPADVFVSANSDWMAYLDTKGATATGTRFDLTGNRLVLIASPPVGQKSVAMTAKSLSSIIGADRLAMALVNAVPAGVYGKAALQKLGVWQELEAKVVQTDNVRSALALVATGAVPFGIVYATDALAEPRVSLVGHFPDGSHPPIIYPVAAVTNRDSETVRAFLDYLRGPQADKVLTRLGFAALAE